MQLRTNYKDIPENIKSVLQKANLFYTEAYEANVVARHQKLVYLWSDYHILVVRIKKKFFLKAAVLESEPFLIQFGEDESLFLDVAMEKLHELGVQWVVVATTARFQSYPSKSKVVPTGNYIVDLTLTEEQLWSNVHSKHRNSIKRGEKSGIEITKGGIELIGKYAPLSNMTYSRSGKDDSNDAYYQGLMHGLDDNALIMLASFNDNLQSAGMFYYNEEIAYYLHGASISRPEPGSTNYLLWKAILYFKSIGVKKFSFVGYHYNPASGSKLEGIQRFKERFGGYLEQSYNFRCVFNKFAYAIYGFVMQVKANHPFRKFQDGLDVQMKDYNK